VVLFAAKLGIVDTKLFCLLLFFSVSTDKVAKEKAAL